MWNELKRHALIITRWGVITIFMMMVLMLVMTGSFDLNMSVFSTPEYWVNLALIQGCYWIILAFLIPTYIEEIQPELEDIEIEDIEVFRYKLDIFNKETKRLDKKVKDKMFKDVQWFIVKGKQSKSKTKVDDRLGVDNEKEPMLTKATIKIISAFGFGILVMLFTSSAEFSFKELSSWMLLSMCIMQAALAAYDAKPWRQLYVNRLNRKNKIKVNLFARIDTIELTPEQLEEISNINTLEEEESVLEEELKDNPVIDVMIGMVEDINSEPIQVIDNDVYLIDDEDNIHQTTIDEFIYED